MPDLKPCPFCGYAYPRMTEKRSGNNCRNGDMYQILCGRCKARGPIFTAKYTRSEYFGRYAYISNPVNQNEAIQKAIDAWNRRANDADAT